MSCQQIYPIALRKAKIVYNFGLSECNRVKAPEICPIYGLPANLILLHSERFNPTALRKAKLLCNFGLSECSRVKALENKYTTA